jgi:ZIP family zinc transporter
VEAGDTLTGSVINDIGFVVTMSGIINGGDPVDNMPQVGRLGLAVTAAFVVATGYAATAGGWKLLGIAWVAYLAMALGGALGARTGGADAGLLVWGYGLASGAMVTSAAVFLVPQAIDHHIQFGGFGIALGLLFGFAGHTVGHRLAHIDLPIQRTVAELTAHSVTAGLIIGIVYGNMPELGATLGLAIVSHKGPAGYAAATRLVVDKRDWTALLLPAAGVGLAAVLASVVQLPAVPAFRGVVFGFAAGVFLHVAMDFLPRCELGSEIHDHLSVDGDAHALLDRLRTQAVASTLLGGLAVFTAWVLVP